MSGVGSVGSVGSVGGVGACTGGTRTEGGARHANTTQNDTARAGGPHQPSQSQTYDIRRESEVERNNPSIDTDVCYERTTRGAL